MNLIPFGKDTLTKRLVDVSEVAKGAKCSCICPGCGIPLIARQGNKKEWHFAHTKDHTQEKTGLCKYSWFVALRMMIRQILYEEHEIFLPEYTKYNPLTHKKITITKSHRLTYDKCITDVIEKSEGHSFDAKLAVRTHFLHVFVSYKGRKYFGYHHGQDIEGIIEIDLMGLRLTRQKQLTEKSCVAQLRNMLKNPHPCKQWRYHKREQAIEEQSRPKIVKQEKQRDIDHFGLKNQAKQNPAHPRKEGYIADDRSSSTLPPKSNKPMIDASHNAAPPLREFTKTLSNNVNPKSDPEPIKDRPFYCIMCSLEYKGTQVGRNPCPQCKQHLYRREL